MWASSLTRYWARSIQLLLGLASAVFLGSKYRARLITIFYCFTFETPPTWKARFPYLFPPGTG
jgi:hypothetical protein